MGSEQIANDNTQCSVTDLHPEFQIDMFIQDMDADRLHKLGAVVLIDGVEYYLMQKETWNLTEIRLSFFRKDFVDNRLKDM